MGGEAAGDVDDRRKKRRSHPRSARRTVLPFVDLSIASLFFPPCGPARHQLVVLRARHCVPITSATHPGFTKSIDCTTASMDSKSSIDRARGTAFSLCTVTQQR